MKKKAAIELSIDAIIVIVLAMAMLILGMVLVKNIINPQEQDLNYKILLRDCDVYQGNCNESTSIEVQQMNFTHNGSTVYVMKENINNYTFNYWCDQLDNKTWGCSKYIVILE